MENENNGVLKIITINDTETNYEALNPIEKSKRTDQSWKHFHIDKQKRSFKCLLCKKNSEFKFNGNNPSTTVAKRHLERLHPKQFIELETHAKRKSEDKPSDRCPTSSKQAKLEIF